MKITKRDIGKRVLIRGGFSSTLMEVKMLEVAGELFKVEYISGAVSWDKKSDYEIVERLPANLDQTTESTADFFIHASDCTCDWKSYHIKNGYLTWEGGVWRIDLFNRKRRDDKTWTKIHICPQCGHKLAPPAEAEKHETPKNQKLKPLKGKKLIIAVLKDMRFRANRIDTQNGNIPLDAQELRKGLGSIEAYFKVED